MFDKRDSEFGEAGLTIAKLNATFEGLRDGNASSGSLGRIAGFADGFSLAVGWCRRAQVKTSLGCHGLSCDRRPSSLFEAGSN